MEELKNGINRILNDKVKYIPREVIRVYGRNNWQEIIKALTLWEKKGLLKLLKNPKTCNDDEICIEMLKYIDKESPIDNWP